MTSDEAPPKRASELRRQQAFDATCELICENGAHGVTVSAVAERMGVSRQWLYSLYPDLDSIYFAIYEEVRCQFLLEPGSIPFDSAGLAQLLRSRADQYLSMPPACAIVALSALHGGGTATQMERGLRNAIYSNLREAWVKPLVAAGHDETAIMSSIVALVSVMFGLVVAIYRGIVTTEMARIRLIQVIDGLVGLNTDTESGTA